MRQALGSHDLRGCGWGRPGNACGLRGRRLGDCMAMRQPVLTEVSGAAIPERTGGLLLVILRADDEPPSLECGGVASAVIVFTLPTASRAAFQAVAARCNAAWLRKRPYGRVLWPCGEGVGAGAGAGEETEPGPTLGHRGLGAGRD